MIGATRVKKIFTNPVMVILFAILCNALWGSAYPAIKIGYALFNITDNVFDKLLFAGVRFVLAGLMVLIVSIFVYKKPPVLKKETVPYVGAMAILYTALQYVFFYVGLSNTTGTNGSIVNSTQTFLAVILAHFIYKDDKLNVYKVIGSIIGFMGVLTVTASGGNAHFSVHGEGFILIAAACFVLGSVISKKATQNDLPMSVTGYNLLFGGIILVVVGICGGGALQDAGVSGALNILYLAFLSAAAFTIWTMLLTYNPVSKISIYNFIIPVSGTILSAIFLGEDIRDIRYVISLALVCMGIVIVNKFGQKA
ncbi:MAG: DMT family transporter [Clostridia bacterium]|nr:DMT family transporter [Clostridia bacterium]